LANCKTKQIKAKKLMKYKIPDRKTELYYSYRSI